jgi:hypothetical protein
MSTKFVAVKKEPAELLNGTFVIKFPDFLEQIQQNKAREPRGNLTAATHLRYVVGSIGEKFDPELSAYTVRPHLYEGRAYSSDKELSKIVVEMLQEQYPKIFEKFLDMQIKNRPANTKLIYYVGDFVGSGPFFANGIDAIAEKDVDVFLGLKEKKVVGKPAVKGKASTTDEAVDETNTETSSEENVTEK